MIGERENFDSETHYGSLVMRPYNIEGNEFNAFYDSSDNLVFVLDNTVNTSKPNILLVINPDADKKWDEILSGDYGVDLETIRPKQDNKYQKFDIEYSGLSVYENLIKAYNAGDSLEEPLNQLTVLRDSAARHSAMTRLNVANEIITKTNTTIVKTKESIVRLQARLKTLRAKLSEAKKGIGREPTKQSASKILKLESQIEATNEKIKRANERLKSAQKRLETATVDAELASQLLNQPSGEIKQSSQKKVKPVVAAVVQDAPVVKKISKPVTEEIEEIEETEYEEPKEEYTEEQEIVEEENHAGGDSKDLKLPAPLDVKEEYEEENITEEEDIKDSEKDDEEKVEPLFKEDPQILNNDIAFKPISFEPPVSEDERKPDLNLNPDDTVVTEEAEEESKEKPVLESMLPVQFNDDVDDVKDKELSVGKTEEDSLDLNNIVDEDVRQSEPVVEQKTDDAIKKISDDNYTPMRPVPPVVVPPVILGNTSNVDVVRDNESKQSRPSFLYYFLLIVLIVLAVFTLWLYQKSINTSAPVVTATVERTESPNKETFFKKQQKSRKPIAIRKEEKKVPVVSVEPLVKEKPVKVVEVVEQEKPIVKEPVEDVVIEKPVVQTAPEVIDAVPARLKTSGQSDEKVSSMTSEEYILANKPVYEPGSKHDEMFVSEEDVIENVDVEPSVEYQEEDVIYMPEEGEIANMYIEEQPIPENDPYFDAEEAAYQAEISGFYEE